jgi:hypothetical protein
MRRAATRGELFPNVVEIIGEGRHCACIVAKTRSFDNPSFHTAGRWRPGGGRSAGRSKPSVLASIKVDGSPCAAAIQQQTVADYGSLLSPGNLLLPADRAKEAQPVFERALCSGGGK